MAGLFGQLEKTKQPIKQQKGGLFKQLSPIETVEPITPSEPIATTKSEIQSTTEKPVSGVESFVRGLVEPFEKIGISAQRRQLIGGSTEAFKRSKESGTQYDSALAEQLAQEQKIKEEQYIKEQEARQGITPFKAGKVVGEIGKFAIPYGTLGGAVEKATAPLASKIAAQFVPSLPSYAIGGSKVAPTAIRALGKALPVLTVEGAKDLVIGAPIDLQEGLQRGLKGKDLAKYMGEQAIYNLIGNSIMLGGEALFKSGLLRKTTTEQIDNIAEQVAKQTELPKETIKNNINTIKKQVEVPKTITQLKEAPIESTATLKPIIEPITQTPLKETSIQQITPSKVISKAPTVDIDASLKPTKFTQTAIKSDATSTELQRLIDENPAYYKPTTEIARQQVAKEIIDSNENAAIALVKQGNEFKSDVESAIGLELVPKLQNQGRFDEALDIIQAISRKGSKAGQFVQQMAAWSKSTPEGMLKWADKTLSREGLKLDKATADNINNLMKNINEVNVDSMKQTLLDAGLKTADVETMQLDRLKALNTALAQKEVIDKIPVSKAQKISSYQAISHLLNAKTMGRNLFGNTTFALAENLSKVYGTGFDRLIAAKTGVKTSSLPTFVQPYKEAVKRFKEAGQEIKLGVELGQGKYDLFRGKTFKKGVLSKLEEALSRGLKQPDEAFKGFIETQSLHSQVKARIGKKADNMTAEQLIKNATPKELEQAQLEALYATFQDNSLPAQLLQGAKDITNKVGIGKTVSGSSGIKTKEFGLGDLLVKYTKVPGNILSRGIEYTPAGYIKGLLTMNEAFKTGSKELQREAANAMGRATNGTSIIAFATWLADKGLIVGEEKDRSYDAKALDRAEGLGNYKLNVSALNRMLLGQNPAIQSGDELASYNWNQPISTSLALGASIYEQLKKQGATPQAIGNVIGRASEEILDLPTLYIIQQMFYEGMKTDSTPIDIAAVPLTQGTSGFIPGPIRQLAQYTDPTLRETKGKTQLETAQNKIISSIPELRKTLEPRISPLGEEMQAKTGVFETFLSPGTITKFKPSQVTPFLKKIEDLTGDDNIYPQSKAPNSVTENKVKLPLTPQEKTQYQKTFGESVSKQYSQLIPRVPKPENLNKAQLDNLTKFLLDIKRKAREEAKQEILRRR